MYIRTKRVQRSSLLGGLALGLVLASFTPSARANIYATDIRLNGGITNLTTQQSNSVTISYILNEPALLGVTINILSGNNTVRSITIPAGQNGAARGTNTVVWDGTDNATNAVGGGTYSVSITAATSGYTNWAQTSYDTNVGNYVWEGRGIAVDRNPASPYYGRVFVANAGPNNPPVLPGDQVGILKLNADGSPADESPTNWASTGGYAWAGDLFSPWKIEVSADDYVYVGDFTSKGEVYRWDPTISTNSQLHVLRTDNWGNGGNVNLSGPAIFGTGTNTEIWMADDRFPGFVVSLGLVRYRVTTNGTCATNDPGTVIVGTNGTPGLDQAPFDVALDQNHNIYTIQNTIVAGDASQRVFRFPAYQPASNGAPPEVTASWAVGGGDDSYAGAYGITVDPTGTYVAVACRGLFPGSGNTKILYATNGAPVATLDAGQDDTDCAWDAVGNVYYIANLASPPVWRTFSPPGTNQATTVALATVQVIVPVQPIVITNISISSGMVTLLFVAGAGDPATAFTLQSAPSVTGPYPTAAGASISLVEAGVFMATVPVSGPVRFYRIFRQSTVLPQAPRITRITVSGGTATLLFTGAASDPPSAFTLQSAGAAAGPYANAAGATITGSNGSFQATVPTSGPVQFYRIRR